tara:strand:+ start:2193 stop:2612 length:420 start_codon:yes stop_codon:yes gene_type:complete
MIRKYRIPNLTKDLVSTHIQKKLIEDNFNWIKCFVKDGSLIGGGKIQPKGCKKVYNVNFVYSPNNKGRKDNICIKDKKIKFGLVPHLYNDNSLCLYHPSDLSPYLEFNFIDTIPWISKWLVTYELWLKYGVWLDKEFRH